MAFRIHDSVVRGEIDNRVKGIVRGKLWVEGHADPVVLELEGNAWPDLAGCLLTFTNPQERVAHQHLDSLEPLQRGSIGDLTASRKVRVFDVPLEEAMAMFHRKEKPPEHMANCLYLEWYSEANGRVVIESTDYELTISAPEWRMTPEEDEQRASQAAAGLEGFMKQLTDAVEQQKRGQKDPEEPWDEHDYEKFLKESDARTDKYMELQDKYGDSDEAEEKIAREMGWLRELTEEEAEEERRRIEEINAACEAALNEPPPEPDPHREGIDWIRTKDGDFRHPLQHRCFEGAARVWQQTDDLGLDKSADKDLEQFISEFQITGAKLAGALDGIARGEGFPEAAFTVAYLKRALDHLHKSQAGLEALAPRKLLPETMVAEARKELFEIREGILRLMDEFRGRPGA
jgi:PAS domain-containing protein